MTSQEFEALLIEACELSKRRPPAGVHTEDSSNRILNNRKDLSDSQELLERQFRSQNS